MLENDMKAQGSAQAIHQPDLSIIIPVFNTEEDFLKGCLSSVAGCFDVGISPEVIVVDDGSESDCVKMLHSLVDEFVPFALLVSKENGGQNSARNLGLRYATGRYVLFLDSDDMLIPDELSETLSAALKYTPEIICFNFYRVDESGEIMARADAWEGGFTWVDPSDVLFESDSLSRQLYRSDVFRKAGISLVEGPRIGEDMASAVPLLLAAESVATIGCSPYLYLQRASSALHSVSESRVSDILDAATQMLARIPDEQQSRYKREIEGLCIEHVVYWGSVRAADICGPEARFRVLMGSWMDEHFPLWRVSVGADRAKKKFGLGYILLSSGHWKAYLFFSRTKRIFARSLNILRQQLRR